MRHAAAAAAECYDNAPINAPVTIGILLHGRTIARQCKSWPKATVIITHYTSQKTYVGAAVTHLFVTTNSIIDTNKCSELFAVFN